METVNSVSGATATPTTAVSGGVTVVGSNAPSDYHIAQRSENLNHQTPGSAVVAPPSVVVMSPGTVPDKKKRGRPRKYGPDGVATALSPKPISSAAPAPPIIDFSSEKKGKVKPASTIHKTKYETESVGDWFSCTLGANFTPHIITINAGEGRFEILSLTGSFMPNETGGTRSRSGGMSVSLAGPDGRVLGGGVAGLLVAASPVQVVVGSFLAGNQHEQKPKKQKHEFITTVTQATAVVPIPITDPKPNLLSSPSFRGDSWSSLPSDSRNVDASVPAG
ncbi:hypothetical protein ACFE04_015422 [Oxalis oulophora]